LVTQTEVNRTTAAPDPRPFADQIDARHVPLQWPWTTDGTPAGCHTVTAVVADQNDIGGKCNIIGSSPSARITWFVWLHESTSPPGLDDTTDPKIDCFDGKSSGVTGQ